MTSQFDNNVGAYGFIKLIDVMGTDADIAEAARVSYGKGTKSVSDDENLINYLMRHNHTSPFEMCEIKLHIKCPMDVWRQWIRHRTANVNEYSTRYSEAIDDMANTKPEEWRLQSTSNKQGSTGKLTDWPTNKENYDYTDADLIRQFESPNNYLTAIENHLHYFSKVVYKERLDFGIAREQARKDLPLSTYTEAYWKIDLHNMFHFLKLRMDPHAQLEIREYANIIGYNIVAHLFPIAWRAFLNYKLFAITLSLKELQVIITENLKLITNKREKEECIEKLKLLNIEFPI